MTHALPCGHLPSAVVGGACVGCAAMAAAVRLSAGAGGRAAAGPGRPPSAAQPPEGRAAAALAGGCVRFGGPTGETVLCPSCGGRAVALRVFGCTVYGRCLPTVRHPGYGFCGRCPHHLADKDKESPFVDDRSGQGESVYPQ